MKICQVVLESITWLIFIPYSKVYLRYTDYMFYHNSTQLFIYHYVNILLMCNIRYLTLFFYSYCVILPYTNYFLVFNNCKNNTKPTVLIN